MDRTTIGLTLAFAIAPIINLNSNSAQLGDMIQQAEHYLNSSSATSSFTTANKDNSAARFDLNRAIGDAISTTLHYAQSIGGVEVIGKAARFDFDARGKMRFTNPMKTFNVDTTPRLTANDALAILRDRYHGQMLVEKAPELKIFQDFGGTPRLVYTVLTRTNQKRIGNKIRTQIGQKVYVDAHTGGIVMETPRTHSLYETIDTSIFRTVAPANAAITGHQTVMTAYTKTAHTHTGGDGYPEGMDLSWYDPVYSDDKGFDVDSADRSAVNALINSRRVYEYYKTTFGRKAYNDKDAVVNSVVHVGIAMNNAFWSDEVGSMLYGDGDDKFFTDLTIGLDVAGHEMTHGVISNTCNLEYAAEPGALNESLADFFGKMIDYLPGDWDIGATIMADGFKGQQRALRNMMNPEEFDQPGTNDSPKRESTKGPCNAYNDECGVHTNSGIPNHAAALIVDAIGKEKTEKLYYDVITKHLTSSSGFADMAKQTENACELMYGKVSPECDAVKKAFETVKM